MPAGSWSFRAEGVKAALGGGTERAAAPPPPAALHAGSRRPPAIAPPAGRAGRGSSFRRQVVPGGRRLRAPRAGAALRRGPGVRAARGERCPELCPQGACAAVECCVCPKACSGPAHVLAQERPGGAEPACTVPEGQRGPEDGQRWAAAVMGRSAALWERLRGPGWVRAEKRG